MSVNPVVKPCHDYPFRSDIAPYQSKVEAELNAQYIETAKLPCCHWTVGGQVYGQLPHTQPHRVCAGALKMLRGSGPGAPVHTTLGALRKAFATNDRFTPWLNLQPKHAQQRIKALLACQLDYFEERAQRLAEWSSD